MANYKKVNIAPDARTELHDALSLTGAEISINSLPAGAGVPFVHSHKNNEEIYAVLSGKGKAAIDGETESSAAENWRFAAGSTRIQSPAASSTVSPSMTALPFPERTA